ncbi:MAG: hypothetical protein WCY11_04405 [Novosphingobium sp.]
MTDKKTPDTISEAKAAEAAKVRQEEHNRKMWVPFPLAGDDVFLSYGLRSLAQIEEVSKALMPDYREQGYTPFGVIERFLLDGHPGAIRAVLDAGLKRKGEPLPRGGFKAIPAADIDLDDDLPWSIADIVEPALNAICYSWFRQTYSEKLAEVTAALEALNRAGDDEGEAA